MIDQLSVVQTPMFHATPARFAWLLPGYAPTRVMLDGAYSTTFNAAGDLLLALAWATALATAAVFVLRRKLGAPLKPHRTDRSPSRDLHARARP